MNSPPQIEIKKISMKESTDLIFDQTFSNFIDGQSVIEFKLILTFRHFIRFQR